MSNFVSFYDYRNLPTDVIDNAIVFVQTDVGRSMYLGVGSEWKYVGPLADGLGKRSLRQSSCISGCKALFWRAFDTDTNTLYIVNEQPNYDQITVGPGAIYTEDTDYHIAVGDRLSIINDIRVDFVTVTEVIYGNAIKLDRTIFTTANEDTRDFRYLVIDYDKPDIGVYDYSAGAIAFGDGSKAIQTGSISFGTNTLGAGAYSTAGGRGSQAGFCATAIGNYAKAYGTYSTAFGSETLSNGSCAFSAGSGASAIGAYSVSIGRLTNANNQSSQAFGTETNTWADFSSTFGYRTSATNKSQFVIGRYNKETDSTHSNSDTVSELFIIGNGSSIARSNAMVVTNYGSIVLHDGTIGANVYSSIVAGSTNTINASNSIIAGRLGVINSADSILVGATNDDGFTSEINANNSAAFGMGVKVRSGHRASTVTGFGTQSSNPYCLIGGLYNAGISNNLFEIGNGNKTTGSNAFAVSRTGTARLGANPVNPMDAATKQYVDNNVKKVYSHAVQFSGVLGSDIVMYVISTASGPYTDVNQIPKNISFVAESNQPLSDQGDTVTPVSMKFISDGSQVLGIVRGFNNGGGGIYDSTQIMSASTVDLRTDTVTEI